MLSTTVNEAQYAEVSHANYRFFFLFTLCFFNGGKEPVGLYV